MRGAVLAMLLLVLGPAVVRADDFRAYDIEIIQPWVRATAPGVTTAAVYMKLANTGTIADRLLRASAPGERVALHTYEVGSDEIRMRPVKSIELLPGDEVMLKPGGLHLMLSGLTAPLALGTTIPLTLLFERGGSVDITAEVTGPGAMEPPGD